MKMAMYATMHVCMHACMYNYSYTGPYAGGGFEEVRQNPPFCSLKLILSLNIKIILTLFSVHHAIHTCTVVHLLNRQ